MLEYVQLCYPSQHTYIDRKVKICHINPHPRNIRTNEDIADTVKKEYNESMINNVGDKIYPFLNISMTLSFSTLELSPVNLATRIELGMDPDIFWSSDLIQDAEIQIECLSGDNL